MQLVNLTPHPIVLEVAAGSVTIPPSGKIARLIARDESADVFTFEQVAIPVVRQASGEVADLPASRPDTVFIVSRIVAERCPDRADLFFPTDLLRDASGRVTGARALGSVAVVMNEPQKLVLLCGGNPLPLLLATMTLEPKSVVLVHTSQTREVAERVSDAVRERGLGIGVEMLPLSDGSDAQSIRRDLQGVLGPWKLDYTGGTKAMATQARLVFGTMPFGRPQWATYVDYGRTVLRHDDGQSTPLADLGLTLSQIAHLHGVEIGAGPTFDLNTRSGHRIARTVLGAINSTNSRNDRIAAYRAAHDLVRSEEVDSKSGRPLKEGEWLEWLTAELAATAVESVLDAEVVSNQHIGFGAGSPNAELDVIVRVESQVSLLTCGAATGTAMVSELKLKAMEAMQRARQLAGDKAQVGLVCMASDEQVVRLQNQLKGSVTTPALKIFGSRDLERFLEGDIAEFSRWLGGSH